MKASSPLKYIYQNYDFYKIDKNKQPWTSVDPSCDGCCSKSDSHVTGRTLQNIQDKNTMHGILISLCPIYNVILVVIGETSCCGIYCDSLLQYQLMQMLLWRDSRIASQPQAHPLLSILRTLLFCRAVKTVPTYNFSNLNHNNNSKISLHRSWT